MDTKSNRFKNVIKIIITICIIIIIVIAVLGNIPTCPDEYEYDKGNDICTKLLETDSIENIEYRCAIGTLIGNMCYRDISSIPFLPIIEKQEVCPEGYTKNPSGVYGGLEVPTLKVPGIPTKCYRREYTKTISLLNYYTNKIH